MEAKKQVKAPPSPSAVFREYEWGIQRKNELSARGMYEQNRVNERFFAGDQWHGANCGAERPLVRHNVIKRIGDYKMAVVNGQRLRVRYSAEGVPRTADAGGRLREARQLLARGGQPALSEDEYIALITDAMSDYYEVTAERVGLPQLQSTVLQNAYIGGTGVLYTYWDDSVQTGLYADYERTTPVLGDIRCEVLNIENVYMGDPTTQEVQRQPSIVIAQRRRVDELRAEAARYGASKEQLADIQPDDAGDYAADSEDADGMGKATVLTRLWKQPTADGVTVMAVRVCRGAVIRPAWDIGVRLYPLALFCWDHRRGCVYGESEVTYLIENQIAINRMLTASVWATLMMGMPIMLVNGDVVTRPVTNDPGQILTVYGSGEDMDGAVRFITPPDFSTQFDRNIQSLIDTTLNQAGANSALLGDVSPQNTSAILAVREAALLPLQQKKRQFMAFCAEVARIWAEFWVTQYGRRPIKLRDENGVWYLPFDAPRYRSLLLNAAADVSGEAAADENRSVELLGKLLDSDLISLRQYLDRLPSGSIPDVDGLLRELTEQKGEEHEQEET